MCWVIEEQRHNVKSVLPINNQVERKNYSVSWYKSKRTPFGPSVQLRGIWCIRATSRSRPETDVVASPARSVSRPNNVMEYEIKLRFPVIETVSFIVIIAFICPALHCTLSWVSDVLLSVLVPSISAALMQLLWRHAGRKEERLSCDGQTTGRFIEVLEGYFRIHSNVISWILHITLDHRKGAEIMNNIIYPIYRPWP